MRTASCAGLSATKMWISLYLAVNKAIKSETHYAHASPALEAANIERLPKFAVNERIKKKTNWAALRP